MKKGRRFNRETLKTALLTSGIKYTEVSKISSKIFETCHCKAKLNNFENEKNLFLAISYNSFNNILIEEVAKCHKIQTKKMLINFELACDILEQNLNFVILLGGPSGTGKSSIANLLGARLGIPLVLSTDSIRHIMRNFLSKEENPLLFESTYNAGKYLSKEESENLSDKKRIIKGQFKF